MSQFLASAVFSHYNLVMMARGTVSGGGGAERLLQLKTQFRRAVIVVCVATAADIGVLSLVHRLGGLSPGLARVPAIGVYCTVLLAGTMRYVFNSSRAEFLRSGRSYLGFEFLALLLKWGLFHMFLRVFSAVTPEVLALISIALISGAFSYPTRRNLIYKT